MSRQVKKVNISGKEDKSNKVSSWSNTTTDTHYPSEKLVKDSLDGKANSTHTHSQYLTEHQDLSNYVTTDDNRLSDARTPTSHTHTKSQITDFPTLPSASSTVPSADTTNGSYGSGTTYARSNHTHPKSSLYAGASHTHSQYLTSHQDITGKEDKSNKVTGVLSNSNTDTEYPSAKSVVDTLDDFNGYVIESFATKSLLDYKENMINKSSSITTDTGSTSKYPTVKAVEDYAQPKGNYLTQHQSLANYVQKSNTSGLLKNDGSVDTTQYLSSLPSHNHDDRYYTESEVDTALNGKANSSHTHTKSQITDFPSIPSKTSELTNDSGFLTSHQDISGKIDSAGTGLSKSGTTLNHSNSITALTTASFKKVKYDSQGHITGTSDVSASDLPTHTHSQYLTSHQDITGKEDSTNKVSSWNSTTNNTRYPTEKLVKDSLDGKADNNHTHDVLLSSNDDSDIQLFNVSAQGVPQGEGQSLGVFLLEFWKKIYPIGSIYMNVNNVDPAILFGGQWEQIEDIFLLASGSTYGNGTTGGSADATLVSHQHGTNTSGEYFVTSESSEANNTRVTYSTNGNRYVDGMTASTTPFHHRVGTGYVGSSATGKNMPPYLAVNVWKRIA